MNMLGILLKVFEKTPRNANSYWGQHLNGRKKDLKRQRGGEQIYLVINAHDTTFKKYKSCMA
jgi:hypothetical protein